MISVTCYQLLCFLISFMLLIKSKVGGRHADCEHRGVRDNSRLSNEHANGCGPTISPTQSARNRTGKDLTQSFVVTEACPEELSTQAHPLGAACATSSAQRLDFGAKGVLSICDSRRVPSPAVQDLTTFQRESGIGMVDGTSGRPADVQMQSCREPTDRIGGNAIKKAVSDYVVQLLTPLYKTKRIQKEDFKAIVKKSTAKVRTQPPKFFFVVKISCGIDATRI